jgi:hypothetical protein
MKNKRRKKLSAELDDIKFLLTDLRDGELNPCNKEDGSECPCHRFDEILDLLENLKEI